MPRISALMSKVSRIAPETLSIPTVAKAKPSVIETMVLSGGPLPKAMKEQKASR